MGIRKEKKVLVFLRGRKKHFELGAKLSKGEYWRGNSTREARFGESLLGVPHSLKEK